MGKRVGSFLGLLLTTIVSGNLMAQQAFTLKGAMDYGEVHSYELRTSKEEIAEAQAKVKEVIASGLPQIQASGSYQNFIKQPVQIVPAEFAGGQPGDDPVAFTFGTKQNMTADLTLSQLVFDGAYLVGLKAAKEVVKLSSLQKKKTSQQVKEEVANSYFRLLVARENVKMLQSTLETLERLAYETKLMYENGLVEKSDADQVRINLNNVKIASDNSVTQAILAETYLKYKMGYPIKDSISLIETLDQFIGVAPSSLIQVQASSITNLDYQLAVQNLTLNELNYKAEKAKYLPTLSAFVSHSQNAFSDEFSFFNNDQAYYPTTLFGINASIPLFTSTMRMQKVKQTKIQFNKAKILEEQAKEGFYLNLANAKQDLKFKYQRFLNEKEALVFAESIRNKTQIKFKEGVSGSFDVAQAENQYLDSQRSYINSMLEYLVARTTLSQLLNTL